MSKKVIIIGSGIAGISSSLKLKSYGINSTILDKGNFLGGRLSTREVNNETYLTVILFSFLLFVKNKKIAPIDGSKISEDKIGKFII